MTTEPGPASTTQEAIFPPTAPAAPVVAPEAVSSSDAVPSGGAVPLTSLRAGDRGRLHVARLVVEDREILYALGLAEKSSFRVCKTGDPWIVKVRGTRIGLSPALADHLLVIPGE